MIERCKSFDTSLWRTESATLGMWKLSLDIKEDAVRTQMDEFKVHAKDRTVLRAYPTKWSF
jgi:hypothetical protein